jgi:pyruvate dehydrogenase E1 component alpha subunit
MGVQNKKEILKIYKNFLYIRLTEEEIAKKYTEWRMRCPTHLSVGQELVSACIQSVFSKKDSCVSSHRAHAHYLGKGGNLKEMISEIYGKATGSSGGIGGSMHLIDLKCNFLGSTAIVGNTIPIGVGHAFANKINKKNFLSLIFFGDAAVETGVFYESINFANLKKLKTLFVCENNFYSVYTPLQFRQTLHPNITRKIEGLGIKTFRIDTANWKKTIKSLYDAKKYIIQNSKPVFMEFLTYRKYEHVGPFLDDNLGYRSKKEIDFWRKRDSFKKIENFLLKKKILNKNKIDVVKKNINKKINDAFKYAEESKYPKFSILKNMIYKRSSF